MPFYRINGMLVHMRGTKMPPSCTAIIEHEGKRVRCHAIAPYLCDWSPDGGKSCDAPMCDEHRAAVGPDRDYCTEHAKHAKVSQPGLFSGLMS
jgi:hypothetical protein